MTDATSARTCGQGRNSLAAFVAQRQVCINSSIEGHSLNVEASRDHFGDRTDLGACVSTILGFARDGHRGQLAIHGVGAVGSNDDEGTFFHVLQRDRGGGGGIGG